MSSLKHVDGRVLVKADKDQKNNWTFQSMGVTIRLERDYNNLDRSYTQQTLGVVIDAEGVPKDALLLFHFNSLIESNKVYNHSKLSGEEIASGVEIYSIPENLCYLWKMPNEEKWNPCGVFEIAERIFAPYTGVMQGIEPTKIKDTLYVRTGEYKGLAVKTLVACDPILHFRNEKGVDEGIIYFRPYGCEKEKREPEAVAIMHDITDKINRGDYLIGTTTQDCRELEIEAYAE